MMENNMPDCVWPEWKFVKQIGRGAYGTVYEAVRHDEFNVESRAAIKVISIPQDPSELDTLRTEGLDQEASRTYMRKVVDAFVGEVKMMIAFKGAPNILTVEDYKVVEREHEIGWDIQIRMELLTPLYSYLADKTLTEAEVAKLGCDICSALEVCATKHVIHRDIKPGNIFIDDFGTYKLGDFGIARQMEDLTTEMSRKGTGSYMAPEVEKGLKYNASVDLYSLGLVLYLLMNQNRLPFLDPKKQILTPNDREQAIRRRLDGEKLPPPCDASPKMTQIILSACEYDPSRRFASPTAMKTALQTIVNESSHGRGRAVNTAATASAAMAAGAAAAPKKPSAASASPPSKKPSAASTAAQSKNVSAQPAKQKKKRKTSFWVILICIIAAAAVCAWLALRTVQSYRNDQYDSLVEQQAEDREAGELSAEEDAYEQAVKMFPARLESYYQHAKTLHDKPGTEGEPDYTACVDFIDENILQNDRIDQDQSGMTDIWYLYADSLFQEGNYEGAVDGYLNLFEIGTNEPLYYQSYSIALAYDGYYTKAESILEEAESLGLGNDGIYYTEGEVEKARQEYDEALEDFDRCIRASGDEDLIGRAYLACAEIYRTENEPEKEREALMSAKDYDTTKLPQILQDLIQVDMDLAETMSDNSDMASAYRQEAIDTLNQVVAKGWDTFVTYNNLAFLYQQEGNISGASNILQSVADRYGSDYRWHKRSAFLEIAKQEAKSASDRDYSTFAGYYNKAVELYQDYLSDGGASDNEMSVLDQQYKEVKNEGWL
ncbi:MAG: protein kinase [Lachnospiraceae bacterium]|nr:protein kinase [Lachnospiraceae bacterium]